MLTMFYHFHVFDFKSPFDFMHSENDWDISRGEEIIEKFAEAQLKCPRAVTYTSKEIKNLLLSKEIEVTDIWKDHVFKYDIPSYIEKRYVVRDCFENMSEENFSSLCEELGWHTMVKAKAL